VADGEEVAIDGKTSRRSGKVGSTPLHLVSAFAASAARVLGQRATAQKSNEKTAIPELLATLALEGCIVTIDAMGTQPNIAQAIRARGADYVLSVKDNQPKLAEQRRTQDPTTLRRILRRLPRSHPRSYIRFMQLPCTGLHEFISDTHMIDHNRLPDLLEHPVLLIVLVVANWPLYRWFVQVLFGGVEGGRGSQVLLHS